MAVRRNRHGRGLRGPLAWPPVPVMGSRREAFDDLVRDCAERSARWLGPRHADVEFAVEDVPAGDPAPWEEQVAPLGRTIGGAGTAGLRVVVYRRPIEARVTSLREAELLVREVVAEQVAAILGVPPEEIEL